MSRVASPSEAARPKPHKKKDLSLAAIFAAPVVLFVLSLFGLIAALIGDGVWDWIGLTALASTIAALIWATMRRRIRNPNAAPAPSNAHPVRTAKPD